MKDLFVDGIYANRTDDPTLYCILGGNACTDRFPDNAWNQDAMVPSWLAAHPSAVALPISSRRWRFPNEALPQPRVYRWVEDHSESLNVYLVREGHYAAGAMFDMVEADERFIESMGPLVRDQAAREFANIPAEDKSRRLIPDADYVARIRLVSTAESDAKANQRGI